jgi:hypothetical protein
MLASTVSKKIRGARVSTINHTQQVDTIRDDQWIFWNQRNQQGNDNQ